MVLLLRRWATDILRYQLRRIPPITRTSLYRGTFRKRLPLATISFTTTAFASAALLNSEQPDSQVDEDLTTSPIVILLTEENQSTRSWLWSTVIEPILTVYRFAKLLVLFLPVFVASPILLVSSEANGLSSLSCWWYGLLTNRMQRAGPTFVKAE